MPEVVLWAIPPIGRKYGLSKGAKQDPRGDKFSGGVNIVGYSIGAHGSDVTGEA